MGPFMLTRALASRQRNLLVCVRNCRMPALSEVSWSPATGNLLVCVHVPRMPALSDVSWSPATGNLLVCERKGQVHALSDVSICPMTRNLLTCSPLTLIVASSGSRRSRPSARGGIVLRGPNPSRPASRESAFGEGRFPTKCVWRGVIPNKSSLARGDS